MILMFCSLTVLYYYRSMLYRAINVFFFLECLPEDGRERPKHVASSLQVVYRCI
jgi:hypothetical protein